MKATSSQCSAMPPATYDWAGMERSLDTHGNAVLPGLLTAKQCDVLASRYARDEGYRTRIVMARHGFGRGEYKYFSYPLPPLLDRLRHVLYPRLAPIANLSTKGQRADVIALRQGDAVLFTVNQRPVVGLRGVRRVAMRHGVSRIRRGKRHTVGLIFHDAN